MIAGKSLLNYSNLFPSDNYKTKDKITYKYSKKNMARENVNLDFRFEKKGWNKKLSLEEPKYNELIDDKDKNGRRILNYFKHFFVFVSLLLSVVVFKFLHLLH